MLVLDLDKSNSMREKYIKTFVNTDSDFYNKYIKTLKKFSDGLCYIGYLWDCFKQPNIISEKKLNEIMNDKKNIYIMWDIHSSDRIFIPNYWKFPKRSVLFVEFWTDTIKKGLPEDIYLFDETFSWSAVFTHETNSNDEPYCLYLKNTGNGTQGTAPCVK